MLYLSAMSKLSLLCLLAVAGASARASVRQCATILGKRSANVHADLDLLRSPALDSSAFERLEVDGATEIRLQFPKGKTKTGVLAGPALGLGGTKSFYQVTNGLVMAVPSRASEDAIAARWEDILEDEVRTTAWLNKAGLLTSRIRAVAAELNLRGERVHAPTYVATDFEHLAKQGVFVMDVGNPEATRGRLRGRFNPEYNLEDEHVYRLALRPLKRDVEKLAELGLGMNHDMNNLAFVRRGHPFHTGSEAEYEVRVFLFDFSHPGYRFVRPDQPLSPAQATNLLKEILAEFFYQARLSAGGDCRNGCGFRHQVERAVSILRAR